MYDELLNFLLSRKRKLLTKEETDKLLQLIAKCMGVEDEYKERTDSNTIMRELLDNVSFDDELSYKIVIDDVMYDDSDISVEDFELMNMYKDETDEPLHQRKFKRPITFEKSTSVTDNKKKIGIKKMKVEESNNSLGTDDNIVNKRDSFVNFFGSKDDENYKPGRGSFTCDSTLISSSQSEELCDKSDANKGLVDIVSLSAITGSSSCADMNSKETDNAESVGIMINNAELGDNDLELNDKAMCDNVCSNARIFQDGGLTDDNTEEYKFELGDLESVHNDGPEYKFIDDNNKEI